MPYTMVASGLWELLPIHGRWYQWNSFIPHHILNVVKARSLPPPNNFPRSNHPLCLSFHMYFYMYMVQLFESWQNFLQCGEYIMNTHTFAYTERTESSLMLSGHTMGMMRWENFEIGKRRKVEIY